MAYVDGRKPPRKPVRKTAAQTAIHELVQRPAINSNAVTAGQQEALKRHFGAAQERADAEGAADPKGTAHIWPVQPSNVLAVTQEAGARVFRQALATEAKNEQFLLDEILWERRIKAEEQEPKRMESDEDEPEVVVTQKERNTQNAGEKVKLLNVEQKIVEKLARKHRNREIFMGFNRGPPLHYPGGGTTQSQSRVPNVSP